MTLCRYVLLVAKVGRGLLLIKLAKEHQVYSVIGLRDIKSRGSTYQARNTHVTGAQAYIRALLIADRTSSIFLLIFLYSTL
jgi:hypothetical protein